MAELWDVLDENGNKTGLTCERGPLKPGAYHLVVHVWVVNSKGEFLISKRTPNKTFPNLWECTGGSAITGDDSLATALKETREELGIILEPENGRLFRRYKRTINGSGDFSDVWVFKQDVDINDIVLLPDETCDAMWADEDRINSMITNGTFIGRDLFFYLDELFFYCSDCRIQRFGERQGDNAFWANLDKLVSESKIVIDRPKGSRHPRYGFVYPLDYGYLENTASMDGNGIDVWKGTRVENINGMLDAIICTVDLMKKDSEIKILLYCNEEEKQKVLAFHNEHSAMKGIMIRR